MIDDLMRDKLVEVRPAYRRQAIAGAVRRIGGSPPIADAVRRIGGSPPIADAVRRIGGSPPIADEKIIKI